MEHIKPYLDRFTGAEDFIRNEVAANRGNRSIITKGELLRIASDHEVPANAGMGKAEIYDRLRQNLSLFDILKHCKGIGVKSYNIQEKFGISHKEVKKLEESGFLKISGYETARLYGKWVQVPLYDPVRVYELTVEEVRSELEKLSVMKKRTERTGGNEDESR